MTAPDEDMQSLDDLRNDLVERYRRDMYAAQEKLVQSLLDSGKDISQYTIYEQTWTEDYTMHYKCWAEENV